MLRRRLVNANIQVAAIADEEFQVVYGGIQRMGAGSIPTDSLKAQHMRSFQGRKLFVLLGNKEAVRQ